ncbi:hypothetical protein ACFQZ4_05055 [Catellatospora coxensis]|uniref:DDE family transposase n=1 Tax=Catellatospora coxensis TaxID=310354 RepID=A0A8J3PD76_9ACTN|nr:hypothetical protein Cco03nite_74660 [Catellatospora coxensis]
MIAKLRSRTAVGQESADEVACRFRMAASTRLKRRRGLATRYDKLAVRCRATYDIAAISEWL